MCHTSARFDVIILITRTLNDTRRSKTIKKIIKYGWKIRIPQHRLDKHNSQKKKCVLMKKRNKRFLQHLPVPIRHAVKSFEVVIIPVLYNENTWTCRFPVNLQFKPVMTLKFWCPPSKGEQINFMFLYIQFKLVR